MPLCGCGCGKEVKRKFLRGHNLIGGATACMRKRSGSLPREIKYQITNTGCWECISHYRGPKGYPMITVRISGKRHNKSVSRFVYERQHGPLDPNIVVCHTCDNPACINPNHLYAGTCMENNADRVKRGRSATGISCASNIKLNPEDVIAIRKSTLNKVELANNYGINLATVYHIKKRKTWKWLP